MCVITVVDIDILAVVVPIGGAVICSVDVGIVTSGIGCAVGVCIAG